MPAVSIIIPVYNAEMYLHKCIESALAQTVSDIEIVLVNDSSTDRSLTICREFAAKDDRIKVYDKTNGGVSDTRNYGMERCTGEYLMFLDADDWLTPDAVETCMPYIPEYDMVRFSAVAVFPHKVRRYRLGKPADRTKAISAVISRKTIVACWGGIIRKSLFTDNGIRFDSSLTIGEDWLVTAQLTQKCGKIRFLPESYCYCYNKTNSGSCTLNMNPGKIMKQFEALEKIRKVIPHGYDAEFRFTKCLFMQELIDCCGRSEAAGYLIDAGYDLTFKDMLTVLSAGISVRKKFSLLRFHAAGYLKQRKERKAQ